MKVRVDINNIIFVWINKQIRGILNMAYSRFFFFISTVIFKKKIICTQRSPMLIAVPNITNCQNHFDGFFGKGTMHAALCICIHRISNLSGDTEYSLPAESGVKFLQSLNFQRHGLG